MYMFDEGFTHDRFYMSYQSMKLDDRIMKNKQGGDYPAIALYDAILNKIGLSKKSIEKGDNRWINSDGVVFCTYTEEDADNELSMSSRQYKSRKKFLKESGLIDYEEQDKKAVGNASRITIKDWPTWVEENGLINKGIWREHPTSENFYNPSDIVKIQPTIGKPKVFEPTEAQIATYEMVMENAKELGIKFHKTNRMDVLRTIVEKHFGVGKLLTEATVKDLPNLQSAYSDMEKVFKYEEMPDF